jgi:hypothetical protein
MNFICQLQIIYWIEKNIFTKIATDGQLASPEYQKLGKECQDIIKVPLEYQVPVTRNDDISCAQADSNKIAINENIFNKLKFATRKFALLHESVHKKYNDNTVKLILSGTSTLFSYIFCFFTMTIFKFTLPVTIFSSSIVGFAATPITIGYYHKFGERRADTEACYALNCYKCINDVNSDMKRNDDNVRSGYLSNDEINAIGLKLKQKGSICEHHS